MQLEENTALGWRWGAGGASSGAGDVELVPEVWIGFGEQDSLYTGHAIWTTGVTKLYQLHVWSWILVPKPFYGTLWDSQSVIKVLGLFNLLSGLFLLPLSEIWLSPEDTTSLEATQVVAGFLLSCAKLGWAPCFSLKSSAPLKSCHQTNLPATHPSYLSHFASFLEAILAPRSLLLSLIIFSDFCPLLPWSY